MECRAQNEIPTPNPNTNPHKFCFAWVVIDVSSLLPDFYKTNMNHLIARDTPIQQQGPLQINVRGPHVDTPCVENTYPKQSSHALSYRALFEGCGILSWATANNKCWQWL